MFKTFEQFFKALYLSFQLLKSEWIQLKLLHELMKVSHFLCTLQMVSTDYW